MHTNKIMQSHCQSMTYVIFHVASRLRSYTSPSHQQVPPLVKAISMLSYHFLAISYLQQASHLKSIWKNHTRVQQKVETDYHSHYSTQSGQLIRVSWIAAFVVFYKDFDVTRVHTGGSYLQNGVSHVNMWVTKHSHV
jgi:hypothetical protein